MKLLRTLNDCDISLEARSDVPVSNYRERTAARAIVFDQDQKVALLHVTRDGYYKLPGGGLEAGEDSQEALKRECLEEIGCTVEITGEIGEVIEYQNESAFKQVSYGYTAKVSGQKGSPHFEQKEIEAGCEFVWLSLDQAIETLRQCKPKFEKAMFIVKRDLVFLETVKNDLQK